MAIIKEELIYRTNVKDVVAKLEAAIADKNLSSIKLYLQQGEVLQIEWNSELYSNANDTKARLEDIHRQIEVAEESKRQDDLEKAVEMCVEFDYFNEEVDRITQLKDAIITFNKETALALNVCELDDLKRQLQLAKAMGIHGNPLVNEIKEILFECDEVMQRHIQYMVAMELGDIALIVDRQITYYDARLMANKDLYDWRKHPDLKDPTVWASSRWTRREKRAAGFYKHSKDKIHESITKLKDTKLNAKALECNTSIRVVMGDKVASNLMLEAQELLIKALKNPELKVEVYLQLMKQLSENSNPASVKKGWQLFALCLRTFTVQSLEKMIFVFIRQNSRDSTLLLRILFSSVVLVSSRNKKPTLEYVETQFK